MASSTPLIQNRSGLRVQVALNMPLSTKGLVFIAHGLGGFKEEVQMQAMADAFLQLQYGVIRWDATNSLGQSDGSVEHATVTNYLADLEDVIQWAESQQWYQEPFVLAGYSLGSLCALLYAETHPQIVQALVPAATVISGELSVQAYGKATIEQWQQAGHRQFMHHEKPDETTHRLNWTHMIDRLQYDALKNIDRLTMPVLLMVGSEDDRTPLAHQEMLFEALPGPQKELHVIEGAAHSFQGPLESTIIKNTIRLWGKRVLESPEPMIKEDRRRRLF